MEAGQKNLKKSLLFLTGLRLGVIFSAIFLFSSNLVLAAWQEPTLPPPAGNILPPLNTGPANQVKSGGLTISGITTTTKLCFGNIGTDCQSSWSDVLGVWKPGTNGNGVFYDGNNVGIGLAITGLPAWPLYFTGGARLAINTGSYEGLYISRNSPVAYSYVNVRDSNNNPIFKIHESGKVGIGIDVPDSSLSIYNSNDNKLINLSYRNGAGGTPRPIGTSLGQINFWSAYSGNALSNRGIIETKAETLAWDPQVGLSFSAYSSLAKNNIEVMRVAGSGNVGIGTTNPGAKLEVNGQTMLGSASTVVISGHNLLYGNIDTSSGGNLVLLQNGSVEKFRIDKDGNVKSAPLAGTGDRCVQTDANGVLKAVSCTSVGMPSGTKGQTLRHDGNNWAASSVLYNDSANIGIGAGLTNPTSTLSVLGNMQVSGKAAFGNYNIDPIINLTSPSIFTDQLAVGLTLVGGLKGSGTVNAKQLCLDGDCKSSWSSASSNYWTQSDTNLYPNNLSWNIGIGTASPSHSLNIYKDTGNNAEIDIQSVAGVNNHWGIYQERTDNATTVGYNEAEDLRFWNNDGNDVLTLANDGNVGIGITNPGNRLDVNGSIKAASSGNTAVIVNSSAGSNAFYRAMVTGASGIWSFGANASDGGKFKLSWDDLISLPFTNTLLTASTNGNIGIGTEDPGAYKLNVAGDLIVSGSNNDLYVNAIYGRSSAVTAENIWLGDNNDTIQIQNLIKIAGGAPGAGKVLTSDANGLASWQSVGSTASGWTDYGQIVRLNDISDKVGIGTTDPFSKLTVDGGSDFAISGLSTNSIAVQGYSSTFIGVSGSTLDGRAVEAYVKEPGNGYSIYSWGGKNYFEGNVGIGTTNPSFKFHVVDTGGTSEIARFQFENPATNKASAVQVKAGGSVATLGINGPNRTYTDPPYTGMPIGNYAWLINNSGGLWFFTGGGSLNELRMAIDETGKVGIGTRNPENLLHLYTSSDTFRAGLAINSKDSAGNGGKKWSIYQSVNGTSGDLRFWNENVPGDQNLLTLKDNGNIGIGTVSPTSKLHVVEAKNDAVSSSFFENTTNNGAAAVQVKAGTTAASFGVNAPSRGVNPNDAWLFSNVGGLLFFTGGVENPAMVINSAGQVGIGISDMSGNGADLTVDGTVKVSGLLRFDKDWKTCPSNGSGTLTCRCKSGYTLLYGGAECSSSSAHLWDNGPNTIFFTIEWKAQCTGSNVKEVRIMCAKTNDSNP